MQTISMSGLGLNKVMIRKDKVCLGWILSPKFVLSYKLTHSIKTNLNTINRTKPLLFTQYLFNTSILYRIICTFKTTAFHLLQS